LGVAVYRTCAICRSGIKDDESAYKDSFGSSAHVSCCERIEQKQEDPMRDLFYGASENPTRDQIRAEQGIG
jgi:hypothetical protein